MPRSKPDKPKMLADLSAHVLMHGLNTASLRPLAKAAGTSDRMLIYHFGSKDRLIAELLEYLARQMAERLDAALPPQRYDSEMALMRDVIALVRSPEYKPYIRLWHDIVSGAAQGGASHLASGQAVVNRFLDWIALRHPDGMDGAPFMLALIEGVHVFDALGHTATADEALDRLHQRAN